MAIHIYTPAQLDAIRHNLTDGDENEPRYIVGNYVQMADIDMSGYPMYSIGYNPGGDAPIYWHNYVFIGSYDGNGYKIKNWNNIVTEASIFTGQNFPIWATALFGRVAGTIKNVHMRNCNVVGMRNPYDVYPIWSGYFPIDYALAPLVGHLHAGEVKNCSATGVVQPAPVESGDHPIYYPFSPGQLDCGVGGLIGWARGDYGPVTVEQCYSKVNVTFMYQFTDLHGPSGIGGLIGKASHDRLVDDPTPGGSDPSWHQTIVKNCYARGFANSHCQGGGVGGAIGYSEDDGGITIENIYSTGNVSMPASVHGATAGGLIGRTVDDPTINRSYYDMNTSGRSDEGKGEPRTTAEMTYPYDAETTYIDWPFGEVWYINPEENDGYPMFRAVDVLNIWAKDNPWNKVKEGWVNVHGQWKKLIGAWGHDGTKWKKS